MSLGSEFPRYGVYKLICQVNNWKEGMVSKVGQSEKTRWQLLGPQSWLVESWTTRDADLVGWKTKLDIWRKNKQTSRQNSFNLKPKQAQFAEIGFNQDEFWRTFKINLSQIHFKKKN